MVSTQEIRTLLESNDATVVGEDGSKIGKVGQVFLDDQTSEPEWVTVKTGIFGNAESFVPLQRASIEGSTVRVPFDKSTIKDAPRVDDSEGHLDEAEEQELYRYYGMQMSTTDLGAHLRHHVRHGPRHRQRLPGRHGSHRHPGRRHRRHDRRRAHHRHDADTAGTVGRDTSGPTTDDAMTRSEERLNVGTETRPDRQGPAAQVRRDRERHADRPGQPRGGPHRARADHGRQPRRRPVRWRHHLRGARGRPVRGARGRRQGDRAGRAGPHGHRDGDRGPEVNEEVRKEQIDTEGLDRGTDGTADRR